MKVDGNIEKINSTGVIEGKPNANSTCANERETQEAAFQRMVSLRN